MSSNNVNKAGANYRGTMKMDRLRLSEQNAADTRDYADVAAPGTVFTIFDDFVFQAPGTEADHPWILNSGTDTEALDPAITAAEGGVIRLTTGDAGTGVAADGSQLVCAVPVQADSGGLHCECRLRINSAVTDIQVNVGLTDSTSLELPVSISGTTITTTASDAAVFCYDTSQTTDEWYGVAVDSDTDDAGNAILGVAPTADTYQRLGIHVSSDGTEIRFLVDGVEKLKLSGDAGISPDVDLYFTVVANATTTTTKTVDVDYILVQHDR